MKCFFPGCDRIVEKLSCPTHRKIYRLWSTQNFKLRAKGLPELSLESWMAAYKPRAKPSASSIPVMVETGTGIYQGDKRSPCLSCNFVDADKDRPACRRCAERDAMMVHLNGLLGVPDLNYHPCQIHGGPA